MSNLDEDVTQASSVNGGARGIFGQQSSSKYNMSSFYDDLLNLTEDIDELSKPYNTEDRFNNPSKYKKDIKKFIANELHSLNIDYYNIRSYY